jgi:hypothetical protein
MGGIAVLSRLLRDNAERAITEFVLALGLRRKDVTPII